MNPIARLSLLLLLLLGLAATVEAGEEEQRWRFSGMLAGELQGYFDSPAYSGQLEDGQGSLIFSPEFEFESADRRHQILMVPFLRLDSRDDERSHLDLREGYWRFLWDRWELTAGVNRVFWGVTESRHLVDVINQTDLVEAIDGEDKLGQPMIQLATDRDWGRLEGYALLGFRQRSFPGVDGRLRGPLPVDTDVASYESGARSRRIDGALRWSHYFGDWDVGASWFHGTARNPQLIPNASGGALVPHYAVIDQLGIDVQYTRNAWLWKLEALGRDGQGSRFAAAVAGFEYTFYQVANSAADVGLLAEYLYDDRDATAPATIYDDDFFVGARLALNDPSDTALLAGVVVDRDDGTIAALVEAERRIGNSTKIELEARWFGNVDTGNTLALFERDSHVTLRFSWYY